MWSTRGVVTWQPASAVEDACRRLDDKLGRSYEYAVRHFGGPNLYLDEMRKNIDYAQVVAKSGEVAQRLRRRPPKTLVGL